MKPILLIVHAVVAVAATGLVTPALAGPDFVTADRASPLAASDARAEQQPLDDIVYALGDSALTPTAKDQLAPIVRWLGVHPSGRVVIEGHADSTGTESFNASLATRRALLVCNHLIDSGVDSDRIVIAVYGENGARRRPDSLDRRVVMFASTAPLPQLVSAELDHNAIEVSWTHRGTRLRETRGITPVATIAPRSARPRTRR
jgi:hypothetical protein